MGEFGDGAIERSEERRDSSLQERVDGGEVVDQSRGQLAWNVVKEGGGKEASSFTRGEVAQIQTERHEVVQTLVLAGDGKLRGACQKVDNVESSGFESVRSRAAEPRPRESLVEVERGDVVEVGVGGIGTVRESTEDEDTFSSCHCEPSDTSVELRVVVLGLVIDKNALFSKSRVAELTIIILGNADKAIPSGELKVGLVT